MTENTLQNPEPDEKRDAAIANSADGQNGARIPEPAASDGADQEKQRVYLTGWRLHTLTAGLCLSLLLSTLETTIVSTSLVSIVNALDGFSQSGWVVTAYFLTYTGFLVVYAKLSDIVGCKLLIMFAVAVFTVFSIACGLSSSMLLLIVFRAFQGVGASGIYSLVTVMTPLLVPPAKLAIYIAVVSSVFAMSSVLGPLLGGAITDHTTWKWVFFLNGPAGAVAIILLAVSAPLSFPYRRRPGGFLDALVAERAWRRVDALGAVASLAASILVVFALQQAGVAYPWRSAPVVACFVLAGLLWAGFVAWERRLSLRVGGVCEPMFPWRLARNRNAFLTGFPFMAAIINIPQRLQTVNGTTAIEAGLRMLPLLLCSPFSTALAGVAVSKLRLPPLYVLVVGGVLQTVGVGLFSSLDQHGPDIQPAQYGYQIIMGFGFGFNLSTILMMAPMVVQLKDMAVVMGWLTQIRVLGGTIGLAVCSALLNNHITSETSAFLSADQTGALLQSFQNIHALAPDVQDRVRAVYETGYSGQMRAMLYFCAAALLSLALLAERRPRRLQTADDGEFVPPEG
ncbi:major facilitator superfamily transporter [Lasiosphaeria miniovina]|uniref:Major facilitator superfamily transporter n=1 Tax=Lasiosphaeria miniovina TaxID=1954250 RepID=A0AA40AV73_9PEZI|nr:major facilitator superfamily transporter [Lasiosphaeria miniovina]KAK0722635.1 major facilitator superfamily transporter [Lasiosphaeria miniovina]